MIALAVWKNKTKLLMLELLPEIKGSAIELHYWFNDDTHRMDAMVQNKCEAELLSVIKAVAAEMGVSINIETEPIGEGGIRRWFNVVHKRSTRKRIISADVVIALVSGLMASPLDAELITIGGNPSVLPGDTAGDTDYESLNNTLKEKELDKHTVVMKRRSNFYQHLRKYPKLEKISFVIQDGHTPTQSPEYSIEKQNFGSYILKTDLLEPLEVDDAVIEIISPVLKTGNYRWRGLYEGSAIIFGMKSNEFNTLVQTGAIEFKNGTSIKCQLEMKRKINSQGIEVITEYNILGVNEYYNMDIPAIQTKEGKAKKKKAAVVIQQLDLFG